MVALCATLSSTAMVLGAGIAAACSGGGGGGGECAAPPTVSTGSATVNGSNSVTLNGSVNPQGCYTEYAFEYGRSSEGYPDEIIGTAGSGTSPVSVSTSSAIVQPSTSYHFRLSAWSSGGEVTGGSGSFTTKAACPKPTVTTEAASSITPYSATMNGTVNPGGCVTMYKFEWGPSSWGTYPYVESGYTGTQTSSIKISKPASALEPGQSYHFRVSATSDGGPATPGSEKIFTATPLTDYVALGDSYSAGTGTRLFVDPVCRESIHSYPYLLHNAYSGLSFIDNACHGAETSDLLSQASALTEKTKWVTYTIGGNDAGFSEVLYACGIPGFGSCADALKKAKSIIEGTLPARLDTVNHLIKLEAKWAKVFVLDYPHLFNGEDCNFLTFFFEKDMIEMNKLADLLSEKIHQAATKAGANFHFASVISQFNGHAVCDGGEGSATEWINGYSTPKEESFHPKISGYLNGYFPVLLSAVSAFG